MTTEDAPVEPAQPATDVADEHDDRGIRHPHLFRVGDTVCILGEDPWFPIVESFIAQLHAGEVGEIVEFAIQSVCRFAACRGLRPGIYADPRFVYVRVGDGRVLVFHAGNLALGNNQEYQARLAKHREDHPDLATIPKVHVSDLPDTPFWEGDIVRPKPFSGIPQPSDELIRWSISEHPNAFMVTWMHYRDRYGGDLHEAVANWPTYSLGDRLHRIKEDGFKGTDLDLVTRGNLWRRAHGQPLEFRYLAEEAVFFFLIGEAKEVGTDERIACLTYEEALAVVKVGKAHGVRCHVHYFQGGSREEFFTAIRYDDETLGDCIRGATLDSGFRIPGPFDPRE
jgi:hypothetical protein